MYDRIKMIKSQTKTETLSSSCFEKIDEKISFALPKYGSSRFVFRFFGSLECSRLQNSFSQLAERGGFEPTEGFRPQHLSRVLLSATQPHLHILFLAVS